MDIDEFWMLIDTARAATGGDVSKQADLLVAVLVGRPTDEIFAYEKIMDDLLDQAYDATLWDASYIIGCGCSDDGFSDFRGWLIAQRKEVYENALIDPESLVDLVDADEDAQEEEMLYVAIYAYERKIGHEIPLDGSWPRGSHPALQGTHMTAEIRKDRFPKLIAKFGDCRQRWSKWMAKDFPEKTW